MARSIGSTHKRQNPFLSWFLDHDWWLLLSTGILIVAGMLSLYSIDRPILTAGEQVVHSKFFQTQMIRLVMGIVPFLILLLVRPIQWRKFAVPLYVFNVAMLAAVLVLGKTKGGAQRWIQFGPIDFQPSEISKLLIVLTLASFYATRIEDIQKLRTFLLGFVHVLLPMLLIYKQPHLGATIVVVCIWLVVSLVAGVKRRYVLGAVVTGLLALTAAFFIPGALDDYQRERVFGFLEPDHKGNGFHTRQAAIAIGNGGLTGTGYLRGEQKGGRYVPDQQTDFIFTVIAEEGGLVGASMILAVFGFFFARIWWIMCNCKSIYNRMLVGGVFAILVAHTFANLGMVLKLLPVVGLWLPFISFGGTALWLCMGCVALVLRVKQDESSVEMFSSTPTI
jgi:rod shape determining protein RodA